MAKFRVYNVQLLPINDNVAEVGVAGYKRLFSLLRDENKNRIRTRSEGTFHYRHSESVFIGPNEFNFAAGYVYGSFIRYTKTDAVNELGTNKPLFRAKGRTGVTDASDVAFVFDAKLHLLAIDSSGVFPSAEIFGESLLKMLEVAVGVEFPDHELTVNVMSKKSALEDVFKRARAYSVVDVDLTFRNGHDTEEILRELKETQTKSLKVRASAGKGGKMSGLPGLVKNLVVAAAAGLGTANITYFVAQREGSREVVRTAQYKSSDMPVTFQVNRSVAGGMDKDFFDRVLHKLRRIDLDPDDED